jgi:hypothetical protein
MPHLSATLAAPMNGRRAPVLVSSVRDGVGAAAPFRRELGKQSQQLFGRLYGGKTHAPTNAQTVVRPGLSAETEYQTANRSGQSRTGVTPVEQHRPAAVSGTGRNMSVRERLEQANNNGPNRAVNTDHASSAWGSMHVVQRIENQRQVAYVLACTCGSQGQRVSQQELASGVIPVCRLCHGTGVVPGDSRRTYDANVEQHVRQDVIMSPRQRAEQAASTAERKAFEEGSNATN